MSGVVGNPLKDDLRTTDVSTGAKPDPLLDRRAFWVISSVRLIVMPVVGIIMTTICTLFLDLSNIGKDSPITIRTHQKSNTSKSYILIQ
jgi:hypothetical protein